MNGFVLVQMAREHAEKLRGQARARGYSREAIDEAKLGPMELGSDIHVAWLFMRLASEIDDLANLLERECRQETTPVDIED